MALSSDFTGTVALEQLGFGSKSQRMAYVLRMVGRPALALEVEGAGAFEQEAFAPFQGHTCNVDAVKVGKRLLARSIRAVDDPNLKWSLNHLKHRSCKFCHEPLPDEVADHCPRCGAVVS